VKGRTVKASPPFGVRPEITPKRAVAVYICIHGLSNYFKGTFKVLLFEVRKQQHPG
jgi:hypothetical protein